MKNKKYLNTGLITAIAIVGFWFIPQAYAAYDCAIQYNSDQSIPGNSASQTPAITDALLQACCYPAASEPFGGVSCRPINKFLQQLGSSIICESPANLKTKAESQQDANRSLFNCFTGATPSTCRDGWCPAGDVCQKDNGTSCPVAKNRANICPGGCGTCNSNSVYCVANQTSDPGTCIGAACAAAPACQLKKYGPTTNNESDPASCRNLGKDVANYCTGECTGCSAGYTESGRSSGSCITFAQRFIEIFNDGLTWLGGQTWMGKTHSYDYSATGPAGLSDAFLKTDVAENLNWKSATLPPELKWLLKNYNLCTVDTDCGGVGKLCSEGGYCYKSGVVIGATCTTNSSDCDKSQMCDMTSKKCVAAADPLKIVKDATNSNLLKIYDSSLANVGSAIYQNTSGNVGVGIASTVASNSTFLGYNANSSVNGITNSTAIGNGAQVTASNQVVIGNTAVTQFKVSDLIGADTYNTVVGYYALHAGGGAGENTAIGTYALTSNSGYNNTAIGAGSLSANTSGYNNTASGQSALRANTLGSQNTANGMNSLFSSTTGNDNTSIGANSLSAITSGSSNTGVGSNVMGSANGSNNTAIGYYAGYNSSPFLTNLNNSTFLGYYANSTVDGITNSTAIGYKAQVTASNQVVIGNSSVTQTLLNGSVGIGASPDASALLDLTSTTKGLLLPRMTTAQKTAISNPSAGLVVYDSTTNKPYYRNNSTWADLTGPQGLQGPQGPTLGISDSLGLLSTGPLAAGNAGGKTLFNLGKVGIGLSTLGANDILTVKSGGSDSGWTGLRVQNSSGTDQFVVRSDGNVGIGTATLNHTLEVNGTLNTVGAITQNGVQVCLADGSNCPSANRPDIRYMEGTTTCPSGYVTGTVTDGKAHWSSPAGGFYFGYEEYYLGNAYGGHGGDYYLEPIWGSWYSTSWGPRGTVCVRNDISIRYMEGTTTCPSGYVTGTVTDGKAHWLSPAGEFYFGYEEYYLGNAYGGHGGDYYLEPIWGSWYSTSWGPRGTVCVKQ